MRKRKLYLSEFIDRNINDYNIIVDLTNNGKHTIYSSLKVIKNYQDVYNSEIKTWTYSKTLNKYIIILK